VYSLKHFIFVDSERTKSLLGPGGEMLRFIESEYKCRVHRDIPGEAYIFGVDALSVREAGALVQDLVGDIKEGDTYLGEVLEIKDFGALVKLTRAQEAILHISEISHDKDLGRKPVDELFCVGQKVHVKVLQVDKGSGQVRVSRKALMNSNEPDTLQPEAQDLTTSLKAVPKFPVSPPRPWDRNFFRSKIAADAPVKKAKHKDNTSEPQSHQNQNQNQSQNQKQSAEDERHLDVQIPQLRLSSTEEVAPDTGNIHKVWNKTQSQSYSKQPHSADNKIAKKNSLFSDKIPMSSTARESQFDNKTENSLHAGKQESQVLSKDTDRGQMKARGREVKKEIDFELVHNAFTKALNDAKGKNIFLSLLKAALINLDPTFHERNFGFKSFSAFCEALHPHYVITKGTKDGSSIYISKQELLSSSNLTTVDDLSFKKDGYKNSTFIAKRDTVKPSLQFSDRTDLNKNMNTSFSESTQSFPETSTLPRELHSTSSPLLSSSLLTAADSSDINVGDKYEQQNVTEAEISLPGVVAHEPLDLESLHKGIFGITSGLKKRKKPTARQREVLLNSNLLS
jgi:predicted RNA-binding protein with RPS1 domain